MVPLLSLLALCTDLRATTHSVTDRQTDGRTDVRHGRANSRSQSSHCVAVCGSLWLRYYRGHINCRPTSSWLSKRVKILKSAESRVIVKRTWQAWWIAMRTAQSIGTIPWSWYASFSSTSAS